ncbi:MAG TPA: sirohydrochlorin chelatase [Coleofasciculaceae cyanobacterium]
MQRFASYLLVSHGSRDPRPQQAMAHLAELVAQQLSQPAPMTVSGDRSPTSIQQTAPLVGTAALELAPLPLHQQIQAFAEQSLAAGYHQLKLVPLFLLPGVHVMEDIPAEVALAQPVLSGNLTLEVCPYLGSHPRLQTLLTRSSVPVADRILVSHGSRRAGGHQPAEAIAAHLHALPSYWSVSPKLEEQVHHLVQRGSQQIVILPYFLFEGGITDAIAQTVADLQQQFPAVQLHLSRPLGATPELANLIINR